MAGLIQEHSAELDGVERNWRESAATADESAKEQSEKAQKLVERIRERAQEAREGGDRGIQEIKFAHEDEDPPEADPEVESLVQGMFNRQPAAAAATEQPGSAPVEWQVQAGRFGRAEQEQSPADRVMPPGADQPAASTPPPKPAPRRRQVSQEDWDDDDFSGRSWLE